MSAVQFHCPLCDGLFQVDDALSGVEVNCPHCQGVVTVPDLAGAPLPPADEPVELSCPVCAGQFGVTGEMSGSQVTCPHCYEVVSVPVLSAPQLGSTASPPSYLPGLPPQLPPDPIPPPAASGFLYPPGLQPNVSTPTTPTGHTNEEEESKERGSSRETSASVHRPPLANQPVDNDPLLPPNAGGVATRPQNANDLLPPGTAGSPSLGERKPLPASIPVRDTVLIPTEQGYVGVHDPVKMVRHQGQDVELRRLTPEEKARRRVVRNTILFLFCVITLMVVMALFMWK